MERERQKRLLRYVRDRRCRAGGYCFYRLEEPSSSDTYWALAILLRLGMNSEDDETAHYLQSFQRADGGFENFPAAYFVLKGLRLMNRLPLYDPGPYLGKQLHTYDVCRIPAGEASIFRHMYLALDVCRSLGIPIATSVRDKLAAFVLSLRTHDGGFGRDYGTLIDTAQALFILHRLETMPSDSRAVDFISCCENKLFGYVNVPRTLPGYIEHVYWGLKARYFTRGRPLYPEICREIVVNSQSATGGFSRTTCGGIANLENAFYAMEAMVYLNIL